MGRPSIGDAPKPEPGDQGTEQEATLAKKLAEVAYKYGRKPGTLTASMTVKLTTGNKPVVGSATLKAMPSHGAPVPCQWDVHFPTFQAQFLCDGKTTLESSATNLKYDRHEAGNGFPFDRVFDTNHIGFPGFLLTADVRNLYRFHPRVKASGPGAYDLKVVRRTQKGPLVLEYHITNAGKILSFSISQEGQTVEINVNSISWSHQPLKIDTRPKPGYSMVQLPPLVSVLVTGHKIPAAIVRNPAGKQVKLSELCKKGLHFLVFTDQKLSASLQSALDALQPNIPFTVISNEPIKEPYGVYRIGEAAMDKVGIAVTPQFYLVKDGVLLQAWQGWDPADKDTFIQEVKAALKS